jgi:hypothetical protein
MRSFLTIFLLSTILALPAVAQSSISGDRDHLIESYRAFISGVDLLNSNGDRLSEPWQVIRQDRANYHHFHLMDAEDDSDSFFASAENRQKLEAMLARGSITEDAADRIMAGNVHIKVKIYGHGNVGNVVDVRVED